MIRIMKGNLPRADNDKKEAQLVVGDAEPRAANLKVLAKAFAPMVTVRAVVDLKVNPRNARTHSAQQFEQIAASVREFGWITPIVVDEDGVVLAGHGRLQAARLLGLTGVPTVEVKHLTAARASAPPHRFMLADNRLAELAGWDESLLTIELKELSNLNIDFDFEVTGFGTVDLDRLEAAAPIKPSKQEVVPELERMTIQRSARLVTCGSSASIFSCAAAPWRRPPTQSCWASSACRWCSPTRLTTLRLTAMSAVWARSTTPTSKWRAAR